MKHRLIICGVLVSSFIPFGPAHADDWRSVMTQAQTDLSQGNADRAENEFLDAEKLLEAAKVSGGQDELKANGFALVDCLIGISKCKDRKGDAEGSESVYGMGLETLKKFVKNGWKNQEYADYLSGVAELYDRHGKTDQADLAFQRLIEIRTTVAPRDDNKTISAYESYSKFLRAHERTTEATGYETKIMQMKTSP